MVKRRKSPLQPEVCFFENNQTMSNVIYKEVRGTAKAAWQQKAEEHATNGVSFVVRPFNKQLHWPYLEELRERYQLVVRFSALERAAYFDAPASS